MVGKMECYREKIERMSVKEKVRTRYIALEFSRCSLSFDYFLRNYCQILIRRGGINRWMIFNPWAVQEQIIEKLEDRKNLIIYKCRQVGGTWLGIVYYGLWRTAFHENEHVLVISEKDEKAKYIMDKRIKRVFQRLPRWMRDYIKISKNTESMLHFGERITAVDGFSEIVGLDSTIESLPRGSTSVTGYDPNVLLWDEVAITPDAGSFWDEAYPALVEVGGQIVMVSNARGKGNLFYKIWNESERGLNDFERVFIGVYDVPGRDEAWYERQKLQMSDPESMKEQFPRTPEEGFLATGDYVFSREHLQRLESSCRDYKPEFRGFIQYQELPPEALEMEDAVERYILEERFEEASRTRKTLNEYYKKQRVELLPNKNGPLVIFKHPRQETRQTMENNIEKIYPATQLSMGWDIGEGLKRGDYSAGVGIDANTREWCFLWHGKEDPGILAEEISKIGKYFNMAFAVVELNSPGYSTIENLKKLYPVTKLYHQSIYGADEEKETTRLGFRTHDTSKGYLVTMIRKEIARGDLFIPSMDAIWELQSYTKTFKDTRNKVGKAKLGAEYGYYDDIVIAFGLALIGADKMPGKKSEIIVRQLSRADIMYRKRRKQYLGRFVNKDGKASSKIYP